MTTPDVSRFLSGGGMGGFPQKNPFPTGADSYGMGVPGSEYTAKPDHYGPLASGYVTATQATQHTKAELLSQLLNLSVSQPDKVIDMQQKLIRAGLLNPRSQGFISGDVYAGDATWGAMENVLDKAIQTKSDWRELLSAKEKAFKGKAAWNYYLRKFGDDGLSGGGEGGPTTTTNTSVSTRTSTTLDAQQVLMGSLQRNLGRDPSNAEIKAFHEALVAYEKANPQRTTTTTTADEFGSSSSTSSTSGGANPEMFAQNYEREHMLDDETVHTTQQLMGVFEKMLGGD